MKRSHKNTFRLRNTDKIENENGKDSHEISTAVKGKDPEYLKGTGILLERTEMRLVCWEAGLLAGERRGGREREKGG